MQLLKMRHLLYLNTFYEENTFPDYAGHPIDPGIPALSFTNGYGYYYR